MRVEASLSQTTEGRTEGRGVTGIVLAGGRSTRFGADKLSAPLRGRPLLHHSVIVLGGLCEEVLVVLAPGRDPADPATDSKVVRALAGGRLRVIRDAREFQGPLAGLLGGLEDARTEVALAVGGDMPDLVSALLDDLLERLSIAGADAVVLHDGEATRPLPAALRVAPAIAAARELLASGERSLRALLSAVNAIGVDREVWSVLDPQAASLRDVDEPGDLPATEQRPSSDRAGGGPTGGER